MLENQWRDPSQSIGRNLRKIPGVGSREVQVICRELRMLPTAGWADLTVEQAKAVREQVQALHPSNRVRARRQQVQQERELGTVKGRRRRYGLPMRGQRTRTNGRTAKKLNSAR